MNSFLKKVFAIIIVSATIMATCCTINVNAAVSSASSIAIAKLEDLPKDGWFWPAPKGNTISSPFNLYSKTLQNIRDGLHSGIDISGSFLVRAARSGKVVKAISTGTDGAGTPCTVVLQHETNGKIFYTRYIHLKSDSLTVKVGDTVLAGDALARSGNTGKLSRGTHLHFEISLEIDASNNSATKLDPNPPTSLGVKYQSSYSTKAAKNEINKHAMINYTFSAEEARHLDEFQKGCNRCFKPDYYYVSKDFTSRTYPADAAPKGNVSFTKNEVLFVQAEGNNSYQNHWYKVRKLNSDKYFYVFESYLSKPVSSASLGKPSVNSVSAVGNKTVEVKLARAAAAGTIYVAKITVTSGKTTLTKTAEFTSKSVKVNLGTTGTCNVEIYIRVNDKAFTVRGASVTKTVNVKR